MIYNEQPVTNDAPYNGYPNWQEDLLDGESLADDIQANDLQIGNFQDLYNLFEKQTQSGCIIETNEDALRLLSVCIKGMQTYANSSVVRKHAIRTY